MQGYAGPSVSNARTTVGLPRPCSTESEVVSTKCPVRSARCGVGSKRGHLHQIKCGFDQSGWLQPQIGLLRTTLGRLVQVKAEFGRLQGRPKRRAVSTKRLGWPGQIWVVRQWFDRCSGWLDQCGALSILCHVRSFVQAFFFVLPRALVQAFRNTWWPLGPLQAKADQSAESSSIRAKVGQHRASKFGRTPESGRFMADLADVRPN